MLKPPRNLQDALFWVGAVLLAVLLAVSGPNVRQVMGALPPVVAQDLNHREVQLPASLPADRTLVLVGFKRDHAPDLDSWIAGLGLRDNPRISWLRMAVLNDPGSLNGRQAVQVRLRDRYTSPEERARLVPVFTDRTAFLRATGLTDAEHAYALVLGRDGQVLARAEGPFDADRGAALLETLHADREMVAVLP